MAFDPKLLIGVTLFHGSVILHCILVLSWYRNILLSQYERGLLTLGSYS